MGNYYQGADLGRLFGGLETRLARLEGQYARPFAAAEGSSGQAFPTGGTITVDLDAIEQDNFGMVSLAENSLTVRHPGWWLVGAFIIVNEGRIRIAVNGVESEALQDVAEGGGGGTEITPSLVAPVLLTIDDVLTARAFQDSGSPDTVTRARLWALRLGS